MRKTLRSLTVLTAMLLFASSVAGAQTAAPAPGKRLAVVNGETITEDQVRQLAADELEQIQVRREGFLATNDRDQNEAILKTLNEALDEKLVSAEAKKRGISVDALVAAEVDDKSAPPTEDAVNRFWITNQGRINAPKEQAIPQIRMFLQDQDRERLYNLFIERLKKDYKVEVFFDPPRIRIPLEGHPTKGSAQAPVTIVEFSDFECPYCGNLYPILKKIEAEYRDKLRIVFFQFPLTNIHPRAAKAAEASLCADEQKHFWEMHDAMFNDQQNLTLSDLKLKAVELKLDLPQFSMCLDSGKFAAAVKKDVIAGAKLGVQGTPALVINGIFLEGARPYEDIAQAIDDELKRLAPK